MRALTLVVLLACSTGDAARPPVAKSEDAGTASHASVDASSERPTLHVLFIGNSYTYVNDVPGLLTQIAEASPAGPHIVTDSVVKGGWTLENHLKDGVVQTRIAEKTWTHVVLQGQSLEPVTPEYFLPAAKTLADLVLAAGAKPTWFVTWARAPESPAYLSEYTSPDELQDRLTAGYDEAARRSPGSMLACVGEAFRASLAAHPEVRLHQEDGSHATPAGSYLAAATLYVALTGNQVPDAPAASVGTNCADVHVKAAVHFDGSPYDFGTVGTSIPAVMFLTNKGAAPATLVDAKTLTDPFAWTGGAFPCAPTLAPGDTCKISVTFSGKSTASSTLTIQTDGAYHPTVTRSLTGAATNRALLTLSEWSDDACLHCSPLFLSGSGTFTFVVTNRGAIATTSIGVGDPLASPLSWGEGFPGGTGSGEPSFPPAVTLPYCENVLAPGAQCLVRVHIDRPDGGAPVGQVPVNPDAGPPQDRTVSLRYADAQGELTTLASRAVQVP